MIFSSVFLSCVSARNGEMLKPNWFFDSEIFSRVSRANECARLHKHSRRPVISGPGEGNGALSCVCGWHYTWIYFHSFPMFMLEWVRREKNQNKSTTLRAALLSREGSDRNEVKMAKPHRKYTLRSRVLFLAFFSLLFKCSSWWFDMRHPMKEQEAQRYQVSFW